MASVEVCATRSGSFTGDREVMALALQAGWCRVRLPPPVLCSGRQTEKPAVLETVACGFDSHPEHQWVARRSYDGLAPNIGLTIEALRFGQDFRDNI